MTELTEAINRNDWTLFDSDGLIAERSVCVRLHKNPAPFKWSVQIGGTLHNVDEFRVLHDGLLIEHLPSGRTLSRGTTATAIAEIVRQPTFRYLDASDREHYPIADWMVDAITALSKPFDLADPEWDYGVSIHGVQMIHKRSKGSTCFDPAMLAAAAAVPGLRWFELDGLTIRVGLLHDSEYTGPRGAFTAPEKETEG